jgi:peptide/nickel transport system permease protein
MNWNLALRKIVRALLTVLIVLTFVFVVLRLTGDPLDALLGDDAPIELYEYYRALYGLDRPIHEQYFSYLRAVFQGDMGVSFRDGRDALQVVLERAPATLALGFLGLAMSIVLGIPLGILAAVRRGTAVDRLVMSFAVFGFAMPNFFLGILLILLFTMQLQWLPSSGATHWYQYLMPVFTLGTAGAGSIARYARSSMLDVLNKPYMRAATARGLVPAVRLFRHALPNASIPIVTLLGFRLGDILAGTVVIETVFGWPGIGRLLVSAVTARDLAVVQAVVVLVTITMIVSNLCVDLIYGWLDPRIRRSRAQGAQS